ncbi:unnamed protein product [Cylicostephanus goldi]|uniref:Uncharacterized protein n=1 Tax=Cylicostephanus goldi TaxID=71465 RepID=A0A3P6TK65_CYLGO|nr:unnamed protein product [Cylicostephanus goldi]
MAVRLNNGEFTKKMTEPRHAQRLPRSFAVLLDVRLGQCLLLQAAESQTPYALEYRVSPAFFD